MSSVSMGYCLTFSKTKHIGLVFGGGGKKTPGVVSATYFQESTCLLVVVKELFIEKPLTVVRTVSEENADL